MDRLVDRLLLPLAVVLACGRPAAAQGPAAPQAPTDALFHAVAYVDVAPAQRSAMAAAARQYRDARRGDDGVVRIDVFEQIGWPGHFAIVETWRDQQALESHAAAPHVKTFQDATAAIRVSGYDQRPYKTLSVGPGGPSSGAEAVHIVAHVDAAPSAQGGKADAVTLLRRLAEASRKEPGNLRFDVLQHAMRGNHFTVVESWRDQGALDAHTAAAHTKQYRDQLQPISGSPLDERLYKAVQ
jgi:autoinducer 2-degrading protein